MVRTLREYDPAVHENLEEAAWQVRYRTSITGRTPYARVVSRTLLVKGLEYDHAIVLDAGALSAEHLYVAMTRGAASLTVLSASAVIDPRAQS
jgi:DNA helicase IV